MKYLVVDASLNGTGVRDYYRGGYVCLDSLKLSEELKTQLRIWLSKYENAHYDGFLDQDLTNKLDKEGKEIAANIKKELVNIKIDYFSDAKMTKDFIA